MTSNLVGIVGGGLAGLSCGYELKKKGFEIILLEKEEEVGGRTRSEIINGHLVNVGAVWITPELDRTYVKYLKEFGLEDEISGHYSSVSSKDIAILYNHRLAPLTPKSLFLSRLLQLSDLLRLMKFSSYIRRLHFSYDYFDEEMARNHQKSLTDFFRERGFSNDFIERLIQPIVNMVHTPPELISAAFGLRLLACGFYKNKVPRSGMDIIAKAMHEKLGDSLITGAEVTKVSLDGNRFTINYVKGGKIRDLNVDILVLATPLFVSDRLMPHLNLKYDYSNAIVLVVRGRLKPLYRKPLTIFVTRSKNPSNIFALGSGRRAEGIFRVSIYSKPYDLSVFYESYEVLKEVHHYPASGVPRPGAVSPSLETEIQNVYICGDFYRYPSTEAALVSGNRVADMIYVKHPEKGFTRW